MKQLHRPDLFGWSAFDQNRNIDFNSVLWVRRTGNVVVDPLALSEHDASHLKQLGGVHAIILTNSDHIRDAERLRAATQAVVFAPAGERATFPIPVDAWLESGDEPFAGLVVHAMSGSKTPGELALVLDGSTLITGDLIRAHAGGRLDLLPPNKLSEPAAAANSVRRLAAMTGITAVLPGDGWPVFRDAATVLGELVARLP